MESIFRWFSLPNFNVRLAPPNILAHMTLTYIQDSGLTPLVINLNLRKVRGIHILSFVIYICLYNGKGVCFRTQCSLWCDKNLSNPYCKSFKKASVNTFAIKLSFKERLEELWYNKCSLFIGCHYIYKSMIQIPYL